MQRINKVLAAAGLGSRRDVEELILQGRVDVDGTTVTNLATRVNPQVAKIEVDGQLLRRPKMVYYALNKPKGVLSTSSDPSGRMRVIDFVPDKHRVFSVGRLDRYSEGLMLLTNDGDLAQRLAHPRFRVQKTYFVVVAGILTIEELAKLRKGVYLAEGVARIDGARIRKTRKTCTELEILLSEGKNREIRRILARAGHKVVLLRRLAIGPLRLAELPVGAARELTANEIKALYAATEVKAAPKSKPQVAQAEDGSESTTVAPPVDMAKVVTPIESEGFDDFGVGLDGDYEYDESQLVLSDDVVEFGASTEEEMDDDFVADFESLSAGSVLAYDDDDAEAVEEGQEEQPFRPRASKPQADRSDRGRGSERSEGRGGQRGGFRTGARGNGPRSGGQRGYGQRSFGQRDEGQRRDDRRGDGERSGGSRGGRFAGGDRGDRSERGERGGRSGGYRDAGDRRSGSRFTGSRGGFNRGGANYDQPPADGDQASGERSSEGGYNKPRYGESRGGRTGGGRPSSGRSSSGRPGAGRFGEGRPGAGRTGGGRPGGSFGRRPFGSSGMGRRRNDDDAQAGEFNESFGDNQEGSNRQSDRSQGSRGRRPSGGGYQGGQGYRGGQGSRGGSAGRDGQRGRSKFPRNDRGGDWAGNQNSGREEFQSDGGDQASDDRGFGRRSFDRRPNSGQGSSFESGERRPGRRAFGGGGAAGGRDSKRPGGRPGGRPNNRLGGKPGKKRPGGPRRDRD